MKVTEIPFNQHIQIIPSSRKGFLLQLAASDIYKNHIQTVHAAALYALAEATCAQYLLDNFSEFEGDFIPVLRSANVKYKKASAGEIYSQVAINKEQAEILRMQLNINKRALFSIQVELKDKSENTVFTGNFEWFIASMV